MGAVAGSQSGVFAASISSSAVEGRSGPWLKPGSSRDHMSSILWDIHSSRYPPLFTSVKQEEDLCGSSMWRGWGCHQTVVGWGNETKYPDSGFSVQPLNFHTMLPLANHSVDYLYLLFSFPFSFFWKKKKTYRRHNNGIYTVWWFGEFERVYPTQCEAQT